MNTDPKMFVPLVVAGLLAGACGTKEPGTSSSAASNSATPASAAPVFCAGVNGCSGKSECATDKHGCAGQNACKGEGILKMSASECREKGGTVAPNRM